MNVLIVLAHPEPKSFNHAMARHAQAVLTQAGHSVQISDLYAQRFDPVSSRANFTSIADPDYFKPQVEERYATEHHTFAPDIQAELEKIRWCDVLIFQFPLWWFSVPAILKGWVDRVFALGQAYGFGHFYQKGYFTGKRAMLSLTTGAPPAMFSPEGINGPIDTILYPLNHGIFAFTGFSVLPPYIAYAPAHLSHEARQQLLTDYTPRLLSIPTTPPIQYPSLNEYDPPTWERRKLGETIASV